MSDLEIKEKFLGLINKQHPDFAQALAMVAPHAALLADTSKEIGRNCFGRAVVSNDYALVKEMIRCGASPDAVVKQHKPALYEALIFNCDQSVRALLEHKADLGIRVSASTALSFTWDSLMRLQDSPRVQSCMEQMLHAGALETRHRNGISELEYALGEEQKPQYALFLLREGADLRSVRPKGHILFTSNNYFSKNLDILYEHVDAQEKALHALMQRGKLHTLDPAIPEHREMVNVLRSADRLGVLASVGYWEKHGGAERGIELIDSLKKKLPSYLAHMDNRLDSIPLQREASLPHPDCVTVKYAQSQLHDDAVVCK